MKVTYLMLYRQVVGKLGDIEHRLGIANRAPQNAMNTCGGSSGAWEKD
jgi:hypothetical protein